MKNISLKEMLNTLVECILEQKQTYPIFYYRRTNWSTGNFEFIEITEVDLLYGRFRTVDGDFSEFSWELKNSNIYIKE